MLHDSKKEWGPKLGIEEKNRGQIRVGEMTRFFKCKSMVVVQNYIWSLTDGVEYMTADSFPISNTALWGSPPCSFCKQYCLSPGTRWHYSTPLGCIGLQGAEDSRVCEIRSGRPIASPQVGTVFQSMKQDEFMRRRHVKT